MKMGVSKTLLVVLIVVILGHQTSKTNAQLLTNTINPLIQFTGNLVCPENRQPLAGANITVSFGIPNRILATAITGPNGSLNVTVNPGPVANNLRGITNLLESIIVSVSTTNANCPSLTNLPVASALTLVPTLLNDVSNRLIIIIRVVSSLLGVIV